MAHIGCPVLGDSLYGRDAGELIGRQALHAAVLRFAHPRTREEITIKAPLPDDLNKCLHMLAGHDIIKSGNESEKHPTGGDGNDIVTRASFSDSA
jgi:hypothetical protein